MTAFSHLMAIVDAGYSFGFIFIVCDLGQRTSDDFDELNDETTQLDWYLFSEDIKRILLTILINLQEPVVIEIFGSITNCRDCFKKVSPIDKSYIIIDDDNLLIIK